MAITDVRVQRDIQITETKSSKGSVQITGSLVLLAISDAPNPTFTEVATNDTVWPKIPGRIPQINDEATFAGYTLRVTSRTFEYLDDENEFIVKVTLKYDSKAEPEENKPNDSDPDTWHRISISTQSASVPLTDEGVNGDKGGKPARNSAGDPVDGLTEDRALVKLTYTNTQVENPNFQSLLGYVNTVNSVGFLGADARTIRCMGFSGEWDDKNQIWQISVEFLYDPKTWVVKYYDAGFNELVSGERRAILDVQGNPVSKPVPLDGLGQALPPANLDPSTIDAYIVELTAYPYRPVIMNNIFQECGI